MPENSMNFSWLLQPLAHNCSRVNLSVTVFWCLDLSSTFFFCYYHLLAIKITLYFKDVFLWVMLCCNWLRIEKSFSVKRQKHYWVVWMLHLIWLLPPSYPVVFLLQILVLGLLSQTKSNIWIDPVLPQECGKMLRNLLFCIISPYP